MNLIQRTDWIEIKTLETTEDMKGYTTCEEDWIQPAFYYNGNIYWLSDFYRCHGNPWGDVDVPDYIHGYEQSNYFNPLFIQIDRAGEFVKIYEKRAN